ncbi:MAG: hypothetical protein H0V07_11180 [Propionibacteriales bacterium]|nr:hypothetical protein [Propionibacteriales bacterium]
MSISHRVGQRSGDADGAGELAPPSPPAVRRTAGRWTDPRLWAGAVLVLVSVVVGAKVVDSADNTVPVWRAQHDVVAGSAITAADVHLTRVHFEDDAAGQLYLSATQSLPPDARLTRDLGEGELLAVSAVTTDAATPELLPLGVPGSGVPAGLSPGDRVDVWAVPADDRARVQPREVLPDVAVAAVSVAGPGGLGTDRQILVALSDGTDVAQVLAALDGSSIVLVQTGA